MSNKRELLKAELAAVEAGEKFVALKADPDVARDSKKYQAAAAALREARQHYRELRDE